jgi:hypothetical protein
MNSDSIWNPESAKESDPKAADDLEKRIFPEKERK